MTTVLQARPRRFVSTPSVERIAMRALRYLQSGFSVHLRGPAGTGKTTLALHLADLLGHPIMLVFGDDEFKTSDLIGNQTGYTRKKVVDNFIHSVVKVEDELRQNWVDSRLTLACREGFTLVYDEFNRSRPEVNNVLLSALEEKLLVLPPSGNRPEYIRVSPHFRAIFTSNPEEYCGVHATQDALMDRLITIDIPEPDELTQQEILVQKTEINRESALFITRLVKAFRERSGEAKSSGLRSCITIAKVCHEHGIPVMTEDADFRDICSDILLSRSGLPFQEGRTLLWATLNEFVCPAAEVIQQSDLSSDSSVRIDAEPIEAIADDSNFISREYSLSDSNNVEPPEPTQTDAAEAPTSEQVHDLQETETSEALPQADLAQSETEDTLGLDEAEIYTYLRESEGARVSEIEAALGMNRFQAINALRSLAQKGILSQRNDRLYVTA